MSGLKGPKDDLPSQELWVMAEAQRLTKAGCPLFPCQPGSISERVHGVGHPSVWGGCVQKARRCKKSGPTKRLNHPKPQTP